jgi:hypothetical protein
MDPASFKIGDLVSYRVPGKFGDFPFVGTIIAVHDEWIEITSGQHGMTGRLRGMRDEDRAAAAA